MKATINGKTYDTEKAKEIAQEPTPHGDDYLYQMRNGKFFRVASSMFLDGVKLPPGKSPEDVAPELGYDTELNQFEGTYSEESATSIILRRRRARIRLVKKIIPVTDREALVWCVKTQIPYCFRGYVLESI